MVKDTGGRARTLVDLMLREAAAAERYVARGKAAYFDIRTPELRDAVELRVLHFAETATKLGREFRNANPRIPWDDIDRMRNDLIHESPHVSAEMVWKFVRVDMPGIVAKLRKGRFAPSRD